MDAELERNIVWVTAPSGAGKTVVANELAQLVNGEVVTDAAEMLELNKLDIDHQHHFHPHQDEQFIVSSSHHFDHAAIRMADKLRNLPPTSLTVVELARGIGNSSFVDASYKRLLGLVSQDVFARSIFLYVKTMHEQRMAWNISRRTSAFSDNLVASSFRVPLKAMEGFYQRDDFEEVRPKFPCPTYIINNGDVSIAGLCSRIREMAKIMEVY